MKKKEKQRLFQAVRFFFLLMMMIFGVEVIFTPNVYAKAGEETQISFTDNSGKVLKKKGSSWYLTDEEEMPLTSVQYLAIPSGKALKKGYYFFDSQGKLCTKKMFHKVDTRTNGKRFRGTYYFGLENGLLYTKRGWTVINGQKYYLSSSGRRYESCWKGGYYLRSDGRIAKKQKLPDGTYVDCDGKPCKKEEIALSSLKKELKKMTDGYGGTWSVYVKQLKTGDIVDLNDKAMYPASTIKAFVMASIYDQIQNKKLKMTPEISRLLKNMITISDNESYNQLVRYHTSSRSFVKGTAVVNKYLKKNGYGKTGCHSTLHPSSSSVTSDGKRNQASAKDCGLLLERIYKGTCVSKKYSREMEKLLLQQQRRWKIPAGLPAGTKVANKTGETSSSQHDIAIVYGKKADYVLCVFSQGCSESRGIYGIRNISKKVYNYLN